VQQALAQILPVLLDNAYAAAPQASVALRLSRVDGHCCLQVQDQGPGFAPELLVRLGMPVVSSTGGQGIGLWLAMVSASQIAAQLHFTNTPGQGAVVWMEWQC